LQGFGGKTSRDEKDPWEVTKVKEHPVLEQLIVSPYHET
jgi:hypothetical protein